jgi:hypothetical protein
MLNMGNLRVVSGLSGKMMEEDSDIHNESH